MNCHHTSLADAWYAGAVSYYAKNYGITTDAARLELYEAYGRAHKALLQLRKGLTFSLCSDAALNAVRGAVERSTDIGQSVIGGFRCVREHYELETVWNGPSGPATPDVPLDPGYRRVAAGGR